MTTAKDDIPLPNRKDLTKTLGAADFARMNAGTLTNKELAEIVEAAKWALHALPPELDFHDLTSRNPINQVYFRAGLLACREYIARFVEQGGNPEIAQSIRANWWPSLGDDPGAPRLFNFDEVAEEIETPDGGYAVRSKDISANVEALPRAFHFLQHKM